MFAEDEEVLRFLRRRWQTSDAIGERFPGFDMRRLVRAGLVDEQEVEPETYAHGRSSPQLIRMYVLTERGAMAVGIAPRRLPSS
jgi:hypothetical protein